MNELLNLQGLRASYGEEEVLKGIDFCLSPGQIVAICGPSGAGKSTFLTCLMGNIQNRVSMEAQQFECFGRNWLNLSLAERQAVYRKDLGLVFQDSLAALDPIMPLGQQLREVMLEASPEKMQALLASLHLPESILDKYPAQLSGGQIQRMALALALANGPKLIIADEPYSALDPLLQEEMMGLLAHYVAQEGASLLMVTHNRTLAEAYAHRLYYLHGGLLEEKALPKRRQSKEPMGFSKGLSQTVHKQAALLVLEGLSKTYQGQEALAPLDLALYKGEKLGLIGESGAGKSSLGLILAGLSQPTKGQVTYAGKKLGDYQPKAYYQQVQYIFQNSQAAFHPKQKVGKSLEEPLRFLRGMDKRADRLTEIHAIFERFDLNPAWLSKYPHQLSGGQLQRCALVRAILAQPKLLICDEITSALDWESQQKVLQLLKEVDQAFPLTLIFISHQMTVVREIADRFLVLKDGKVLDDFRPGLDPVQALQPYSRQLLGLDA